MKEGIPAYLFRHGAIDYFAPHLDMEYVPVDLDRERLVGALDRGIYLLNDTAIDCILDAVGKEHVPPDIDRVMLRIGIQPIREIRHDPLFVDTWEFEDSPPCIVAKKLKRTLTAIQRLQNCLDDPETASHLRRWQEMKERSFDLHEDPCEAIARWDRAAQLAISVNRENPDKRHRDYVLRHYLPDLWREHFDREPGYSTEPMSGRRCGPYLRFVRAVTRECYIKKANGDEYSDDILLKGARASNNS